MEWSTYLDKSISVYTLLSLELDDVEAESGSEISVLWEEKILFYKQYDQFINSIKTDLNEKCRSYVKNMLTTLEKLPIYNNNIEPIFERDSIVNNIENNVIFRFYTCKVKKLEPGILNSWNPKRGEYKVKTKTTIYLTDKI